MSGTLQSAVTFLAIATTLGSTDASATLGDPPGETLRYLRPNADRFALESEIGIERTAAGGTVIQSVTGRGNSQLTLTSRFTPEGSLESATVKVGNGSESKTAQAVVSENRVKITRRAADTTELDCPTAVIVTSAPDWTDTVLLVRRYDRKRGGTQEFAGLWVHPVQQPLRLTFKITQTGEDTIERAGKAPALLQRYLIEIRGGSRYTGWGDERGHLVRLMPATGSQAGIVLEGWEQSAMFLKPSDPQPATH